MYPFPPSLSLTPFLLLKVTVLSPDGSQSITLRYLKQDVQSQEQDVQSQEQDVQCQDPAEWIELER